MEYFAQIHKDPLFSIIVIIAIIVLVAIADYMRTRWKHKAHKQSLSDFAKNFNYDTHENIAVLMDLTKYSPSTLNFIASVYVVNGNFSEAIKIYLTILEKTQNLREKMEVLEELGNAYYKAGFMQRAKNIFIEILKHNPRNTRVLSLLMQTYEMLGDYKAAFSVVSCLEELDINVDEVRRYIQILILINDSMMPLEAREREMLRIDNHSHITHKLVLNYLKSYNITEFWNRLEAQENIYDLIDMLWGIPNPPIARVKSHKQIADIYRAKGLIDDGIACDIFELEVLRLLHLHSKKRGNLGFKYRCGSCQGIFPFETYRCPSCGELGNIHLALEIMELDNEKNYSLL